MKIFYEAKLSASWPYIFLLLHLRSGNKQADTLAKLGADLETTPTRVPVDKSVQCRLVKDMKNKEWQAIWQPKGPCRQTREMIPLVISSIPKIIIHEDRQTASKLVQFLTGHCNMRKHQWEKDKTIDPSCSLCGTGKLETPWHILTD